MKRRWWFGLAFVCLTVAGSAAQDATAFMAQLGSFAEKKPLLILGSPLPGRLLGVGERAELALVQEGNYTGRVFVIDCLPFLVQETLEHQFEYWAFLTDATGFGWDEEHPVRLISDRPLDLSPERDRIRVLGTPSPDSTGWLPLFRVLSAYAHEASERDPAPPSETR